MYRALIWKSYKSVLVARGRDLAGEGLEREQHPVHQLGLLHLRDARLLNPIPLAVVEQRAHLVEHVHIEYHPDTGRARHGP